ncbi:RBR-type E3 ubiquitin transferase [Mycena chlorophos]|uniref:RBR-type E3 ubiquitin transferase n=1 Tax=Mycena chlorophos TaxID=658473 RepID=A0A8H6TIK3_MYCCL|nr:RBR-type E3 ubiquitin transferase [Mycena chlorophos]
MTLRSGPHPLVRATLYWRRFRSQQPPDSPSIFSDGSSDDDVDSIFDGAGDTLQYLDSDSDGMKIQILPAAYKLANDLLHDLFCRLHRGHYIRHYRCRCYHRATDLSRPLARNTSRPRLRQRRGTLVADWQSPAAPDGLLIEGNSSPPYVESDIAIEAEHVRRGIEEGCGLVAPDAFIRAADDIYERFEELLVRHFVGRPSPLLAPTPSRAHQPRPSRRHRRADSLLRHAHKFCFGCTIDSDHRPVVCGMALLWLNKCRDDSEVASWIQNNTKECPKSVSTIEKNGGCNHMTCKTCKNEFCWVCMGPWSEHGTTYHSRSRYDEKGSVDAQDAQSRSQASLERYLHTALEVLDNCRVALKWMYAMAYYLAKGNEKELFEDNQRDLERAVEELYELIESPLDHETIPALRQKVTDKVYVQKRNETLLDDTARGFFSTGDGRGMLVSMGSRSLRSRRRMGFDTVQEISFRRSGVVRLRRGYSEKEWCSK